MHTEKTASILDANKNVLQKQILLKNRLLIYNNDKGNAHNHKKALKEQQLSMAS
jgi:hypothetical protein